MKNKVGRPKSEPTVQVNTRIVKSDEKELKLIILNFKNRKKPHH
jgi:hypothetical protein